MSRPEETNNRAHAIDTSNLARILDLEDTALVTRIAESLLLVREGSITIRGINDAPQDLGRICLKLVEACSDRALAEALVTYADAKYRASKFGSSEPDYSKLKGASIMSASVTTVERSVYDAIDTIPPEIQATVFAALFDGSPPKTIPDFQEALNKGSRNALEPLRDLDPAIPEIIRELDKPIGHGTSLSSIVRWIGQSVLQVGSK